MKRKRFDKDGNTTSLGKVVVVGGTPNANNINSIANNGTTNDSIANELNAIYNPTGIQINVTVDDQISIPQSIWDIENTNGQLDIGNSNTLANYTPEERAIYNYYKTQRTLQDQMYYIFVLGDDISTTDTNAAGFMPLKRQYGFVFNPPNKSRTIAHELGHGIFGLEHPFTEYAIREGTTDLLMDYGTGTAFTHLDWQKIHAPGLEFYVFQGDEDGEEGFDYKNKNVQSFFKQSFFDENKHLDYFYHKVYKKEKDSTHNYLGKNYKTFLWKKRATDTVRVPTKYQYEKGKNIFTKKSYTLSEKTEKAKKLFSIVYGNRYENGKPDTEDGYTYMGKGAIHLTWKENYRKAIDASYELFDETFDWVNHPEYLINNEKDAVYSAVAYFYFRLKKDISKLNNYTIEQVSSEVNGGENGLPKRKKAFQTISINKDYNLNTCKK